MKKEELKTAQLFRKIIENKIQDIIYRKHNPKKECDCETCEPLREILDYLAEIFGDKKPLI